MVMEIVEFFFIINKINRYMRILFSKSVNFDDRKNTYKWIMEGA